LKALEAFVQAEADVGYWHLQNSSDLIRNAHTLSNLERLRIRDYISANAIKSYVDGAFPPSTYTSLMHKEMQKMGIPPFFTVYSLKHAAIEKLVRLGVELPKINKSARLAMNSSVALSYYSLLATNNNAVYMLITKDQDKQKEEVNDLLS
jgi:hypothetical protein